MTPLLCSTLQEKHTIFIKVMSSTEALSGSSEDLYGDLGFLQSYPSVQEVLVLVVMAGL